MIAVARRAPHPAPGTPFAGGAALPFDPWLAGPLLALLGLGLVMVYSASAFLGDRAHASHTVFLERQALAALIGLLAVVALARLDYHTVVRRFTYPLLLGALGLLVLVLTPPFGHTVGGAQRWLALGPLSVQPSELAKPVLVLYFAQLLARHPERVRSVREGLLPALTVLAAVLLLLVLEPDLGTALMLALVVLSMLFVAGAPLRHLAALSALAAPILLLLTWNVDYRRRRLLAFLDPWADPSDSGFQIIQSFLAFGSGGATGAGLGQGRQKLFFLPEPHTDFIFSVLGEELGLLGTFAVVAGFAVLVWRGILVARRAPDRLGALVASGITAMIGIQALIHMGVAVSLLPTKGLPLPFLSHGGSSLVATLAGCGLLFSVDRSGRAPLRDAQRRDARGAPLRDAQRRDARGANLRDAQRTPARGAGR